MHALRVPLLGMMVAVGLLVVENIGATAYRDYQQSEQASVVAEARESEMTAMLRRIFGSKITACSDPRSKRPPKR
jgi:hypothetical protein